LQPLPQMIAFWPRMEVNFSNTNSFYLWPFCGRSCKMASEWLSDLLSPEHVLKPQLSRNKLMFAPLSLKWAKFPL
jgi:hypothetical protein